MFTPRYGLSTRRTAERYVCLEGSGGFVTSTAAPIASGWSDGLDHRFGHFVWASGHQIEAKPYGIGPSFTRTAVHWPKR